MPDLQDGETTEMHGSGSKPYVLKNTGGVYSCSCPAWRNQSVAIERRTCKHLRKLRGDAAEEERIGGDMPERTKGSQAEPGNQKKETTAPPQRSSSAASPRSRRRCLHVRRSMPIDWLRQAGHVQE